MELIDANVLLNHLHIMGVGDIEPALIDLITAEDTVDVVRCRDCWCHKPGKYRFDICSQTEDDFYCARGEKK